jgi:DNA invertase Pin-like site-specific DNA recombinase
LVALDLGLDTTTSAGRLLASVMGSVAAWEREIIAQRTKDAMAVRREQGKSVSRPSVRESMPEIVVRIRHERARGATLQKIADGLNADEIPTARGGALWRPSSVRSAAGYVRRTTARKPPALPEVRRRRSASLA